ncbi:PAS domain-containing protein [Haloplanus pelagicus]|jgi:PAS domain S-box-containing protein|uniref:PAS domain-containing protein n=1 Tax=Haloplanus pelagicus TaxID=2949995 RepID=UPI0020415A20|nr:PAS domain-containing protein [Haloplanus sp. HW8-1]
MTGPIRVLHVDDDRDFADMTATFLEREDERLRVEPATDAGSGLERLASDEFDCVVSDYEMPGRTGVEFLDVVRETHPELPFILFTGRGSEAVASEAISAGVTDYLQKDTGTEQYQLLAKRIVDAVEHRYAETNYREIFEKIPDGVVIQDPADGSFIDMNAQYARMFGYDREELLDAGFGAIHAGDPPYTLENARQRIRRVIDQGPRTFEWPGITKDGEQFWAEVHLTPTRLHGNERILAAVRDVSERRERKRRFEAILDNTYTFMGLLDPNGTVLEANATALNFGGLDRSAIAGKPLWETAWIGSNADARATVRNGVECARNGDLFRDEITIQGSDREAVIDFSIRPVTDVSGEVTLLVPEGRDITDRKAHQRRRNRIIDRVTDAIVEVDADWNVTLVNEQATALYGMDERSLLGRGFWDVFSGALGTRFEAEYRRVMEAREPRSFVEYYGGLGGWFDVQVYPNDDGGLSFYFRDVTDRREQSRELAVAEARYRTLAENVPNGAVFYFDDDLRYRIVSGNGFDPIETSSDDILDNTPAEVDPFSEDVAQFLRAAMEATLDGTEVTTELAYEGRRYELRSASVRDDDGDVAAGLFVTHDVTERRRRKRTLERKNERLEEFTSVVSHDLRTPLDAARGHLELAREGNDASLDRVADALDRSRRLIDDLLTLAREGERVGEREPVDLASVVETCWETIEDADATLSVDTERTILADRGGLRRLLENLLENATEHGGERISVGDLDEGFYVGDDGTGLPEGDCERIFDPGYSTAESGTGFGLRVVERVIDGHGWSIRATHGPEGGARFEITDVDGEGSPSR